MGWNTPDDAIDALKDVFGESGVWIEWIGHRDDGLIRDRRREREARMARVGFGSAQQGTGGSKRDFGELPDGEYPITMVWRKQFFKESKHGDGHRLVLDVCGEGVTDSLSGGSKGIKDLDILDGGMGIDDNETGWTLNNGTMAAFFLRDLEEACQEAGIEFDADDLGGVQGVTATIKNRPYPSSVAKRETYPSVRSVAPAKDDGVPF